MLLVKISATWKEIVETTAHCVVILWASSPADDKKKHRRRANDLAAAARNQGYGVRVLRTGADELFVLVADSEPYAVGFARKMLRESKTAENWFLLRCSQHDPLLKENADSSREICTITDTGFVSPEGHTFEFTLVYSPEHWNTKRIHSLDHVTGRHQ